MTLWALVLAGVWIILLWYQMARYLPEQRAIVGCRHHRGQIREAVPDRRHRYTALVWHCDACPLQVPLKLLRHPNGLWWFPDEEVTKAVEHPDDPQDGQGGEGGVRP